MSERSWSMPLFVVALFAGATAFVSPGCGAQSVGERCSTTNGNKDCDGDLVCVKASSLRNGADGVARCCPESGNSIEACRRGNPTSPIDTPNGTGGSNAGGASGMGGASTTGIGDLCSYTSNCETGLVCSSAGTCEQPCDETTTCAVAGYVCGPQGVCQAECRENVDCTTKALPVCSKDQRCVECAESSDCTTKALPICSGDTCVECVEDTDCSSGTCNSSHVCEG